MALAVVGHELGSAPEPWQRDEHLARLFSKDRVLGAALERENGGRHPIHKIGEFSR